MRSDSLGLDAYSGHSPRTRIIEIIKLSSAALVGHSFDYVYSILVVMRLCPGRFGTAVVMLTALKD